MQTKAVLRYARISPQKCRLVVDTIRGKSATLAVNTLKFMPKKGAKIVLKVLDSAIANAYNNFNADGDDLKVTRIEVDPATELEALSMRAPKGAACRFISATVTSSFKFPTASETPNGSESQSDWYSSWHHPRLRRRSGMRIRRTSPRISTPTSWCASF